MKNQTQNIKTPTQSELEIMAKSLLNDMPALENKLQKIADHHSVRVLVLLVEVIKFLYLVAKYQKSLSPSLVADLAWHEFILCTRLYTKFCEDKFGRYIHHTPGGDEKENKSRFAKTIQLYLIYFKEPIKEVWGESAYEEWLDAQCGTCNSN